MLLQTSTQLVKTEIRDYPEWHHGRTDYALWYIEIDQPELVEYLDAIKIHFSDFLIRSNQRQYHITLFVCGFLNTHLSPYNDDFSHEQSLIISEDGKLILVAGCSHAGIINIKGKAEQIVNDKISYVIAGFHLYNPVSKRTESNALIQEIAERLNNNFTHYYTCHCTGKKAFHKMKQILFGRLTYLSTGSEIEV